MHKVRMDTTPHKSNNGLPECLLSNQNEYKMPASQIYKLIYSNRQHKHENIAEEDDRVIIESSIDSDTDSESDDNNSMENINPALLNLGRKH